MKLCSLCCLPHALCMTEKHSSNMPCFYLPNKERKKIPGGQHMTWKREMKNCTANFDKIDVSSICDLGPKYSSTSWLETLEYKFHRPFILDILCSFVRTQRCLELSSQRCFCFCLTLKDYVDDDDNILTIISSACGILVEGFTMFTCLP